MHDPVESLSPPEDSPALQASSPTAAEERAAGMASMVGKIAALLASGGFPNADQAALRRHSLGQATPLAFYRLWLQLNDDLPRGDAATAAWIVIVCSMARLGTNAHRYGKRLGEALFEAGYSESRLERLLGAESEVQLTLFETTSRFLGAKGSSFDWTDAAQLLLAKDPTKQEHARRRIAEAFYRAQYRASK